MDYCLETNSLSKKYHSFGALESVSMHIPKGAIYGFVGRNGAGKTTLIRLICGLQDPTSGTYSIYGISNKDKKIDKMRQRMGAVIETPAIYPNMSARDNLITQCLVLGLPAYDEVDELLNLVGLSNTGKKRVYNFSLGMKQRLGIAMALCGNPDFLILDEPTNGLDPQGIIEIRELILKLNREYQITILISSHILDELSRIATHYGFIEKGKIIKEVTAEDINNICRKCIRISLTNIEKACQYFNKANIDHQIISDSEIDVFGDINITDLVISLKENECQIKAFHENNESLENYFINMVGGDGNA